MSDIKRGNELEKFFSKSFCPSGVPVLASSKLLRSKNIGQVDLCFWKDGSIIVVEVKSSGRLSYKQRNRLNGSLEYFCSLLKCNGQLITLGPKSKIDKSDT